MYVSRKGARESKDRKDRKVIHYFTGHYFTNYCISQFSVTFITMGILFRLIVNTLAVFAGAYLLPGVHVQNFTTAIVVAIVLGLLNAILKPILVILTIPITILTLGLFLLVINAIIVLLCSDLVSGFKVDSFLSALIFSLLISVISSILEGLAGGNKKEKS